MLPLQLLAGLEDVLLGRHEDENVAVLPSRFEPVDGPDRHLDIVGFVRGRGEGLGRHVFDRHRIHPAADVDDRGAAEGLGELFRVEGRRGDDDLELGTDVEKRPDDPQQEVDVQAPLVGLVDDQRVVLGEAGSDWVSARSMPSVMILM